MLGRGRSSVRGWGVEEHAGRIYRSAGRSSADPPGPVDLIRALGGDVGIHRGNEFDRGDARVSVWPDASWLVDVHAGLPCEVAALALGRGIADWYSLSHVEAFAFDRDEFAAAILVPRLSLRSRGRADVADLARAYAVSPRLASERLLKCGVPLRDSGVYERDAAAKR
jgi:hypothetical protein